MIIVSPIICSHLRETLYYCLCLFQLVAIWFNVQSPRRSLDSNLELKSSYVNVNRVMQRRKLANCYVSYLCIHLQIYVNTYAYAWKRLQSNNLFNDLLLGKSSIMEMKYPLQWVSSITRLPNLGCVMHTRAMCSQNFCRLLGTPFFT